MWSGAAVGLEDVGHAPDCMEIDMAACKKCGKKVKRKARDGWFKCRRCGPIENAWYRRKELTGRDWPVRRS